MSMTEKLRRPARRVRSEDRGYVQATVVRCIDNRARLDWSRLDDDEQLELVDAIKQASEDGFSLAKLSKRGESLVERVVGLEEGAFAKERRDEQARRDAAEADAKARRLRLDKDDTANFFKAMAEQLVVDAVWLDDVATLVGVIVQFAAGKAFAPAARLEGAGLDAELIVDRRFGVWGGRDGEGVLSGWADRLKHLHAEGWLRVTEPGGPEIRIRLGERLLAVLGDTFKEA